MSRLPVNVAAAVRYWMVIEFESPLNSVLLRDVLRVGRDRARDLWAGRAEYSDAELEHLCGVFRKPIEALLDLDGFLDERKRQRALKKDPPVNWAELGASLRWLREFAGLTLDEAAILAHTTSSYLAKAEAGATAFTAGYAANFSGAMGRYIAAVASGSITPADAIEAAREERRREDAIQRAEDARFRYATSAKGRATR